MKHLIILFYVLTLALNCFSQNIKELKPSIGKRIRYTHEEQKNWSRAMMLLDKINEFTVDYGKLSNKDKQLIDKLEMGEGPLTLIGDNWYNCGGPYKIKTSSYPDSSKTTNNKSDNIQDFNLLTAWVGEKPNYGIGQYIEFYFKPFSPRVNKIIIYNGYFKNQSLWKSYSRVKKLKLYINNQPNAILDLADIDAPQSFNIKPIQSKIQNIDLIIKLEILAVYKGSKYSDAAISEINFDGLDVLCLAKGTKISQPCRKMINIEDLAIGDTVLTYQEKGNKLSAEIVKRLEKVNHTNLVHYYFENGNSIISTQDHPFMVHKKGWCSLQPAKSIKYKGFEHINKIKIGDWFEMIGIDGKLTPKKLIKIEYLNGEQETYTISKLSSGKNFIANGFIVGTEE